MKGVTHSICLSALAASAAIMPQPRPARMIARFAPLATRWLCWLVAPRGRCDRYQLGLIFLVQPDHEVGIRLYLQRHLLISLRHGIVPVAQ
jgi:hypothetical protein